MSDAPLPSAGAGGSARRHRSHQPLSRTPEVMLVSFGSLADNVVNHELASYASRLIRFSNGSGVAYVERVSGSAR